VANFYLDVGATLYRLAAANPSLTFFDSVLLPSRGVVKNLSPVLRIVINTWLSGRGHHIQRSYTQISC